MVSPRRIVELIVWRTGVTGDELAAEIGSGGDSTSTRADMPVTEAKWVLRGIGSESGDLSALVEGVISRARGVGAGLVRSCRASDATVILRIIQYVSGDDPVGPGFALEAADVAFLASLNAVLDVDQYVI